ncbi:MAG: hypothetical protein JWR20_295 [Marmoricola sp.]|jgi:AmiR/NasT family two-component response regulator|nr:hypothetical protein [Marmoricola sp.]
MDEDHDPEWVALLAAVRARPPLVRAVEVLSRRHDLDEAGAVRRLMWEAVSRGTGLAEAARTVVDTDSAG